MPAATIKNRPRQGIFRFTARAVFISTCLKSPYLPERPVKDKRQELFFFNYFFFIFCIIPAILLPVTIFIILRVWSNCFSRRLTS